MIVFLTVIYIALLTLLTKLRVVPNTKSTWLTLIPYELILIVGFFIPMQWGAPGGDVRTLGLSVPIVPNVSGEVIEVAVKQDGSVSEGDVLFKIDPVPYQAALNGLLAQLKLAELRLEQSKNLAEQEAGTAYEVESYQAQVDGLKAQIDAAEYNLRECVVRAPSDGIVTYIGLRRGYRVVEFPFVQAMTFIDTSLPILGGQVAQAHARYIEPGQAAEVTFKVQPGVVHEARVMYVLPATAQGQMFAGGTAAQPLSTVPGPFFVRLELEDKELEASLRPGSLGTMAIYTDRVTAAHVIRKVIIRVDSIVNYVSTL